MKRYAIKELFLTLQGEGHRAGSKSLFVRFAGCNLWNGRPEDRGQGKGACALWCDTDFAKAELKLSAGELLDAADKLWPAGDDERWFVVTGGEPLLQLDEVFLTEAHDRGWYVAVETNGSLEPPHGIDWLTVSPKLGGGLAISDHSVDEVKVVLPGRVGELGWTDEALVELERQLDSIHYFVQPQDPILPSMVDVTHLKRGTIGQAPEFAANVKRCTDFVLAHPRWRLSQQTHKLIGMR